MLASLSLKNFRGFKELTLEPLKRVNLILGQNNTGKTALLEALALYLWNPPSNCTALPNLFRTVGGEQLENFWKWLCYGKDPKLGIELKGNWTNEVAPFDVLLTAPSLPGESIQNLGYYHSGSLGGLKVWTKDRTSANSTVRVFSTHPSNPVQDAIDYNRIVLKRKEKVVEAMLKHTVEPRLDSIRNLQTGTEPLIYADIGLSEMIPVTQMGQGFNRLLDIYSEILAADAKVLLIDEIENGLHYSVQKTVWKGLFEAARELDVQIFATTHSWEMVLAADEAAKKLPEYDLNLIRLDRVNDIIKPTIMDAEILDTAKKMHWEMR